MVFGVSIAINGTINEVSIPPKTTDVLEWIRKKYKNPDIQFQGKIQDPLKEERWLSIFASMSGDEEHTNSHILPSPFDEESYTGPIVILANTIEQQDEYDAPASSYINLKPDDYETLYSEWSFVVEEEEEENLEEEPEEEEEDAFQAQRSMAFTPAAARARPTTRRAAAAAVEEEEEDNAFQAQRSMAFTPAAARVRPATRRSAAKPSTTTAAPQAEEEEAEEEENAFEMQRSMSVTPALPRGPRIVRVRRLSSQGNE